MMRRSSMSNKIMEWICFTLREASSDQRKSIRRWKTAEREEEHFCTRKYNEHGRFMSITSINNGGISVLVIPELAMNAGWYDIALKIESFIKCPKSLEKVGPPRVTEASYPYARSVKDSKWLSKSIREAETNSLEENIEVLSQMESHENGLLKRCLVGHLEGGNKERRTLSEVRRWSSLLWKKAFGVNIYEMYGGKFLFEFPNRNMAEQTLQGK